MARGRAQQPPGYLYQPEPRHVHLPREGCQQRRDRERTPDPPRHPRPSSFLAHALGLYYLWVNRRLLFLCLLAIWPAQIRAAREVCRGEDARRTPTRPRRDASPLLHQHQPRVPHAAHAHPHPVGRADQEGRG